MHADAVKYLSDKVGIADVILLDGFDAFGLPASLSSQRFYDCCHAALRDDGVLVANLLNNDAQLVTYFGRIRRACDGNVFRTVVRHEGNTIAIGVKGRNVPDWHDLYARAEAVTASMGLDLYRYVKKMERHHRADPVSRYPRSGKLAFERDI